jgi:hypothetical protein
MLRWRIDRMIIKEKPDREFNKKGINFRIYYRENKVIVKAKQDYYMVIQYADDLDVAIENSKIRLHKLKTPLD